MKNKYFYNCHYSVFGKMKFSYGLIDIDLTVENLSDAILGILISQDIANVEPSSVNVTAFNNID